MRHFTSNNYLDVSGKRISEYDKIFADSIAPHINNYLSFISDKQPPTIVFELDNKYDVVMTKLLTGAQFSFENDIRYRIANLEKDFNTVYYEIDRSLFEYYYKTGNAQIIASQLSINSNSENIKQVKIGDSIINYRGWSSSVTIKLDNNTASDYILYSKTPVPMDVTLYKKDRFIYLLVIVPIKKGESFPPHIPIF
ncbi:MAG: hypothetical protein JST70_04675 [Bacteroidetes bacterium]|nr:hypothetical protein [Bacteroidota bacterium]